MEKISLATGIVIIGFATIAFTQTPEKKEIKNVPPAVAAQKAVITTDTIPAKETSTSKFTYVTTIDGKEYKAHIVNDKLTKLYVDGKKIPDEKLGDYKEVTEKIIIQAKTDQDKLEAENRQLAEEREKLLAEQDGMENDMSKMSKDTLDKVIAEKMELDANIKDDHRRNELTLMIDDSKRAEKNLHEQHAQLNRQNAELMALVGELRKQQDIMQEEAKSLSKKDSKNQTELLNKQIIELKNEQMKIEQQRKNINDMMLNKDRNSLSIPAPPSLKADVLISPLPPLGSDLASPIPPIPPIEDNKTLRQIINTLMDRKIISSKSELSIVLNEEIFKVNDVVQPEKIHAEFKDRYITSPQDHVIYSKHGGSTHADINIDNGLHRADLNENK